MPEEVALEHITVQETVAKGGACSSLIPQSVYLSSDADNVYAHISEMQMRLLRGQWHLTLKVLGVFFHSHQGAGVGVGGRVGGGGRSQDLGMSSWSDLQVGGEQSFTQVSAHQGVF